MGRIIGLRGWIALSAVLVLSAGASLGFVAARWIDERTAREETFPDLRPASADPLFHIPNSRIYEDLGLRPEQCEQADRILGTHFKKVRELREDMRTLKHKMEQDLLALLDPPQRGRMRDVIRKIKINDVEERVSGMLAWYRREMCLSSQQEESLFPHFISFQIDLDSFFGDQPSPKRSRGEMAAALARLSDEFAAKVKPALTGTQFERFRDLEKKRLWWLHRGGPRRPSSERRQETRPPAEEKLAAPAAAPVPTAAPAAPPASPAPRRPEAGP